MGTNHSNHLRSDSVIWNEVLESASACGDILEMLTASEIDVVVSLSVLDDGLVNSLSSLSMSNGRVGESSDKQQTAARHVLGTVENRLPVFIVK